MYPFSIFLYCASFVLAMMMLSSIETDLKKSIKNHGLRVGHIFLMPLILPTVLIKLFLKVTVGKLFKVIWSFMTKPVGGFRKWN